MALHHEPEINKLIAEIKHQHRTSLTETEIVTILDTLLGLGRRVSELEGEVSRLKQQQPPPST